MNKDSLLTEDEKHAVFRLYSYGLTPHEIIDTILSKRTSDNFSKLDIAVHRLIAAKFDVVFYPTEVYGNPEEDMIETAEEEETLEVSRKVAEEASDVLEQLINSLDEIVAYSNFGNVDYTAGKRVKWARVVLDEFNSEIYSERNNKKQENKHVWRRG